MQEQSDKSADINNNGKKHEINCVIYITKDEKYMALIYRSRPNKLFRKRKTRRNGHINFLEKIKETEC